MICCVAYDISDDRTRSRVALYLSQRGIRIQRSVFIIKCRQRQHNRVLNALRQMVDKKDSIALFPLCVRCRDQALLLNPMSSDFPTVF